MKRVNIIITLVTCFAALLTSCIKEGPYAVERVDLKVNITRGSEGSQRGSQQQGDKIENVMIWAFRMTGGAVSNASSLLRRLFGRIERRYLRQIIRI